MNHIQSNPFPFSKLTNKSHYIEVMNYLDFTISNPSMQKGNKNMQDITKSEITIVAKLFRYLLLQIIQRALNKSEKSMNPHEDV